MLRRNKLISARSRSLETRWNTEDKRADHEQSGMEMPCPGMIQSIARIELVTERRLRVRDTLGAANG